LQIAPEKAPAGLIICNRKTGEGLEYKINAAEGLFKSGPSPGGELQHGSIAFSAPAPSQKPNSRGSDATPGGEIPIIS
jgi:hypothetical protein